MFTGQQAVASAAEQRLALSAGIRREVQQRLALPPPSLTPRWGGPMGRPRNSALKQTRPMSLVEAIANVLVGFGIAVLTQLIVFPWFGLPAHH